MPNDTDVAEAQAKRVNALAEEVTNAVSRAAHVLLTYKREINDALKDYDYADIAHEINDALAGWDKASDSFMREVAKSSWGKIP